MILDPDFPRSLRFAVDRMQQALVGIGAKETRSGALALTTELTRLLEKCDAEGLFRRGLHEFLAELLVRTSALHEALREEYFEAHLGNTACGC